MPEAPKMFVDLLPENLREYAIYLLGGGACIAGVIVLMLFLAIVRFLFGGGSKTAAAKNLTEDLQEYPDLKPSSGDRQLRVEGSPARLRLVVVAPAGTASEVDLDDVAD